MDAPLTIVTGGAAGIGRAIARRGAARGDRRLLVARGADRLDAVAGELGCSALAADVAHDDGIVALAERLATEPRIRLLVNNAGGPFRAPLLDHDHEAARAAVDLLYLAMVRVTALAWDGLVAERGRIVNVVSVAGTVATGSAPHYAAAKHAAVAWSRALHVEAAEHGVHVLTANPGPVATSAFPHQRLRSQLRARRAVRDDGDCADRILRALERGRAESFQPEWWRAAAVAQASAPGSMARLARRGRGRFG
ncbi:MAG: SDR family NAD(P)-dependent oxidoreductase [Gaiellales bacterium]